MSPAQAIKLNFWIPLIAAIATGAATAGIAYGMMGGDITRNSEDIAHLQAQESTITDIRIAQGTAKVERRELQRGLDSIQLRLDRQWGPPSGN